MKKCKRSKYSANFFHSRWRFSSSSPALISSVIKLGLGALSLPRVDGSVFTSSPSLCVECTLWSPVFKSCLSMCPLSPRSGTTSLSRDLEVHFMLKHVQACTFLSQPGISRRGYMWLQCSTAIWKTVLIPLIHIITVRYMAGRKIHVNHLNIIS